MGSSDRSSVLFLSGVVTMAVIGIFSVFYVVLRPLLTAVLHALAVLR